MVVVASLIGAKGLGEDVLEALQYANVGQGILAGFAILFCAMMLDRIVQMLPYGQTGRRFQPAPVRGLTFLPVSRAAIHPENTAHFEFYDINNSLKYSKLKYSCNAFKRCDCNRCRCRRVHSFLLISAQSFQRFDLGLCGRLRHSVLRKRHSYLPHGCLSFLQFATSMAPELRIF